jgi:hypothetical protein
MIKQYKIMIFVNILLGLLFIASNLIYDYFGNMPSHHAIWSPLWLTFYNYQFAETIGGEIGVLEPNFSFYFFWVLMAVNVYFIVRLQRSKETKQNPT